MLRVCVFCRHQNAVLAAYEKVNRRHIMNENHGLFPDASKALSEGSLSEVGEKMEQLDHEHEHRPGFEDMVSSTKLVIEKYGIKKAEAV